MVFTYLNGTEKFVHIKWERNYIQMTTNEFILSFPTTTAEIKSHIVGIVSPSLELSFVE